jgi:hypothetical protein
MIRAVEATPMPTCEAGELRALATLTEGVAAHPSIATRENGGLVAYVTDAQHDGTPELSIMAIDAQGAPHGNASVVDTGPRPTHPVLVAQGEGYVLAWREGQPGQERIVAKRVAADGTVSRAVAFEGIGTGWLGAPALAVQGDALVLAVVRSSQRPADPESRRGDRIEWSRGTEHGSAEAPEGGEFDGERAPLIAVSSQRARLFATTMIHGALPGAPRSLVEVALDAHAERHVSVVAIDIASPRAYSDGDHALISWRARVAPHDVAARVWPLDGEVPPLTVATFRGAQDAEVALLPVGENLLGAFTLSTLADDDGGTLNVSVVTDRGQPVGRQPLLVSSLVRSAAVVAGATSDRLLFVLEGRADNGHDAVLGIAPVQCSAANHADRLEVPPAGLVQRLGSLDEPSAQLAHTIGTCSPVVAPQTAIAHRAAGGDVVADTDARLVSLGSSGVFFGVAREQTNGPTRVVVRGIDAHVTFTAPTWSLDGAQRVLAAARAGNNAVAVITHGDEGEHLSVIASGANGRARAPVSLALLEPTSAVFDDAGRMLFVAASSDRARGEHGLFRVPIANGRPGAPVLVASLAPGDEVLDAMRGAHDTTVLLARPDELGSAVSRALAIVNVPDDAAAAARQAQRTDPFVEPRGHGRGPAWLVHGASGPNLLYGEGTLLRIADLEHGAIRRPRSVLGAYEGGGAVLSHATNGTEGTLLTVASGLPPDASHVIAPVSLVALSPRGEVRIATSEIAATDRMIAGRGFAVRIGDRIALAYAQPEGNDAANWRVVQVTCREGSAPASAAPQGGR